jgi:hypothetical protein
MDTPMLDAAPIRQDLPVTALRRTGESEPNGRAALRLLARIAKRAAVLDGASRADAARFAECIASPRKAS